MMYLLLSALLAVLPSPPCVVGNIITISAMSRNEGYVLLWNSRRDLQEYEAGLWPSPEQIGLRSHLSENGVTALVLKCTPPTFFGVKTRPHGDFPSYFGWVGAEDVIQSRPKNQE